MRRLPPNPALAALPHIACCGAPLLIIAVATGALALTDALAIVGLVIAALVAGGLCAPRRASCELPAPDDPEASLRGLRRAAGEPHERHHAPTPTGVDQRV